MKHRPVWKKIYLFKMSPCMGYDRVTPALSHLYSRKSLLFQNAMCFSTSSIDRRFHSGRYINRCRKRGHRPSHCRWYRNRRRSINAILEESRVTCSRIARTKSRPIHLSAHRPRNSHKITSANAAAPHSASERNLVCFLMRFCHVYAPRKVERIATYFISLIN